mgnify:CR=1 FL=1
MKIIMTSLFNEGFTVNQSVTCINRGLIELYYISVYLFYAFFKRFSNMPKQDQIGKKKYIKFSSCSIQFFCVLFLFEFDYDEEILIMILWSNPFLEPTST